MTGAARRIDPLPRFAFASADGDRVLEHDDEGGDAKMAFTVDSEDVDPTEYTPEGGDSIRLEVSSSE